MSESAERFQSKRVLITGGLGTVGSTIARLLVPAGADITLVDCLVPQYGGNLFNIHGIESDLRVDSTDLREADALPALVKNRDIIFNLAGLGCHSDSMREPLRDLDINSRAQLALLEACRNHNPEAKIVYASTRQVYGALDSLPVAETHATRPVDVNGINKLAGEQFHLLYSRAHGLRTCALRMTNTLGPRMRVADSRQVFYGGWLRSLLEGNPFEVWGGSQVRDIEYVEDVARAFLAAAASDRSNGRIFNTGSGKGVTLRELADLFVRLHGSGEYKTIELPANQKQIEIGDYIADISAIGETLGWRPMVSLEEGIARSLDYYRENLAHYL